MDDLIVLNPDASQLTINLFSPDPTFVTDTYSTILSASSPHITILVLPYFTNMYLPSPYSNR
ncbi:hypothetical protein BJV78DRAFT_1239083 [Lactifluus subvellereus]|nr:hypothetical protein BJV78DRAFT_1239083 [Lactifluus subvellereus]